MGDGFAVSPCHPLARLVTIQLHLPGWVVLTVTQVLCWHGDTECDTRCDTKCGSSTGGSLLKQGSCWVLELETSTGTGTGSSSWWTGSWGVGERAGRALRALPSPLEPCDAAHPLRDPGWLQAVPSPGQGAGALWLCVWCHSQGWFTAGEDWEVWESMKCFLIDARPCHAVASVNKGSLGDSYNNSPENNDSLSSYT